MAHSTKRFTCENQALLVQVTGDLGKDSMALNNPAVNAKWYLDLNSKLESIGFKCTESDWSVYIWVEDSECTIITTSVDDILIVSSSMTESDAVVNSQCKLYEITDNGEPTFHLGCQIEHDRTNQTIKLSQQSYTLSILREFGFDPTGSWNEAESLHQAFTNGRGREGESVPILRYHWKGNILEYLYLPQYCIHCARAHSFHV